MPPYGPPCSCTYLRSDTHTSLYSPLCTRICVHLHLQSSTQPYGPPQPFLRIHLSVLLCVATPIYTPLYTYTCPYIHTCMHPSVLLHLPPATPLCTLHTLTAKYTPTLPHNAAHTYIDTSVCTNIHCTDAYLCNHLYAHIHIHTYTHLSVHPARTHSCTSPYLYMYTYIQPPILLHREEHPFNTHQNALQLA